MNILPSSKRHQPANATGTARRRSLATAGWTWTDLRPASAKEPPRWLSTILRALRRCSGYSAALLLLAAGSAWAQPIALDSSSYDVDNNQLVLAFTREDLGERIDAVIRLTSLQGEYLFSSGQPAATGDYRRVFPPGFIDSMMVPRMGRSTHGLPLVGQPLPDGARFRIEVLDTALSQSLTPNGEPYFFDMADLHAQVTVAASHDPMTDRIEVTATLGTPGFYASRRYRTDITLTSAGSYRLYNTATAAERGASAVGIIEFPATAVAGAQQSLSFGIDRLGRYHAQTIAIDFGATPDADRGGIAYTPVSGTLAVEIPRLVRRPVIAGSLPPQAIGASGEPFSLRLEDHGITATDPGGLDADLSFSLRNAPAWLAFDPLTRAFATLPGSRAVGDHDVQLVAVSSDGRESDPLALPLRVRATELRLNASFDPLRDVIHVRVDHVRAASGTKSGFVLGLGSFTLPVRQQPDGTLGFERAVTGDIAAGTGAGNAYSYTFGFDRANYPGLPKGELNQVTVALRQPTGDGREGFAHRGPSSLTLAVPRRPASGHPRLTPGVSVDREVIHAGSPLFLTLPANLFTEPDGEPLTLQARLASGAPLPRWLRFDAATATFSGTPFGGDEEELTIRVTATDPHGYGVHADFQLRAHFGPPTFELELGNYDPHARQVTVILRKVYGGLDPTTVNVPVTVTAPAGYLLDRADDPDDTPMAELRLTTEVEIDGNLGSEDFPATLNVSNDGGSGGAVSARPVLSDATPAAYLFRDSGAVTATLGYPPVITGAAPNQTAVMGRPFSLDLDDTALRFVDPDGADAAITVTASGLPGWLRYDPTERLFTGTPAAADVHAHGASDTITLRAVDAGGARSRQQPRLTVTVRERLMRLEGEYDMYRDTVRLRVVNVVAVTTGSDQRAFLRVASPVVPTRRRGAALQVFATGHSFTTDIPWHAPAGSARHFELEIERSFAHPANPADLAVEVTLASQPSGSQRPFAVDGPATLRIPLPYLAANRAPVRDASLAMPNQEARARLTYRYQVPAGLFTDPDPHDRLSYAAMLRDGRPLPSWLTFEAATGTFSGIPPIAAIGETVTVKVLATDDDGLGAADDFDLAVLPDPPEFAAPVAEYDPDTGILELSLTRVAGGTGLEFAVPLLAQASAGYLLDLADDADDTPAAELRFLSYPVAAGHGSMGSVPPVRLRVTPPADGAAGQLTLTPQQPVTDDYLFTGYAPTLVPLQATPQLALAVTELHAGPGAALSADLTGQFTINGAAPPPGTLRLFGLPAWLSYDAATGMLSGEPADGPARHELTARFLPTATGPASTAQTLAVVVRAVTLSLEASYSAGNEGLRVRVAKVAEFGGPRAADFQVAIEYSAGSPYQNRDSSTWVSLKPGLGGSLTKAGRQLFHYRHSLTAGTPLGFAHEAVFLIDRFSPWEQTATVTLSAPGQEDLIAAAEPDAIAVMVPDRRRVRLTDGMPLADAQVMVGREFRRQISQELDVGLFEFTDEPFNAPRGYHIDAGPSWLRLDNGVLVGTPQAADYRAEPVTVTLRVTETPHFVTVAPLITSFQLRFVTPVFEFTARNEGSRIRLSPRYNGAGERPPAPVTLRIAWTGTGLEGLFTSATSPQVIEYADFTQPNTAPHDLLLQLDTQVIGRRASATFAIEPDPAYRVRGTGVSLDIADPRPAFAIAAGVPADAAREIAFLVSRIGTNNNPADNVRVALAAPDGLLHADEPAVKMLSFARGEREQTLLLRRGSGTGRGRVTATMTAGAADHYTVGAPGAQYNAGRVSASAIGHVEYSAAGVEVDAEHVTLLLRQEAGAPVAADLRLAIEDPQEFLVETPTVFRKRYGVTVTVPVAAADGVARVAFARRQDTIGKSGDVRFALISLPTLPGQPHAGGSHEAVARGLVDAKPAFTVVAGTPADPTATVDFLVRRAGTGSAAARLGISFRTRNGLQIDLGGAIATVLIDMAEGEAERRLSFPRNRSAGRATATVVPGVSVNQDVFIVRPDAPLTPLTDTDLPLQVTNDVTAATGNRGPVLAAAAITEFTVAEDQTASRDISAYFEELDDETLSYGATLADGSSLPGWLRVNRTTGLLTATPAHAHVGTRQLTVTASDPGNASVSGTLTVTVRPVDDPPRYMAVAPQEVTEAQPFRLALADHLTDEEGDRLVFSAQRADGSPLPAWLAVEPLTGMLMGRPGNGDVGSLEIRAAAEELHRLGESRAASGTFTLTVLAEPNALPAWVAGFDTAREVSQDSPFQLDVAAAVSDPDGDRLTFTRGPGFPGWLRLSAAPDPMTGAATAVLTGTPGNADVATHALTLIVADGRGVANLALSLAVLNVNDPTALAAGGIGDSEAVAGEPYSYDIAGFFTDPDLRHGEILSFTHGAAMAGDTLPSWLTFDTATGVFGGMPPAGTAAATVAIRVTAAGSADPGRQQAAEGTFTLTVVARNQVPVLMEAAGAVTVSAYPDYPSPQGSLLYSDPDDIDRGFGDGGTLQFFSTADNGFADLATAAGSHSFAPAGTDADSWGSFRGEFRNGAFQWRFDVLSDSAPVRDLAAGARLSHSVRLRIDDGADATANRYSAERVITVTVHGPPGAATPMVAVTAAQAVNRTVAFTVARSGAAAGALEVVIIVEDPQGFIEPAQRGARTVSFATGEVELILAVDRGSATPTARSGAVTARVGYGARAEYQPSATQPSAAATLMNGAPEPRGDMDEVGEEDAAVTGGVLGNDSDPDGNPLHVGRYAPGGSIAQGAVATGTAARGSYGHLTMARDGSYSYAPHEGAQVLKAGQRMNDDFTYELSDGLDTATATLQLTVVGANDLPTVTGVIPDQQLFAGDERVIPLGSVFTDVDGDALSYSGSRGGATLPAWLAGFDNAAATLRLAPQAGDEGVYDGIVLRVSDGSGGACASCAAAPFTVTVLAANSPPRLQADTLSLDEDAPATTPAAGLLANDRDDDPGDTLTVTRVAAGADIDNAPVTPDADGEDLPGRWGSLRVAADGSYTYTPDNARLQFLGPGGGESDVFAYEVNDGSGAGNAAAVSMLTVTLNGANDRPRIALPAGAAPAVTTTSLDAGGNPAVEGRVEYEDADADDVAIGNGGSIEGRPAAGMSFQPGTAAGQTLGGDHGSLTLFADGRWEYRLADAEALALPPDGTLMDAFVLRVDDGAAVTDDTRYSADLALAVAIMPAGEPPRVLTTACRTADGDVCSRVEYDPVAGILQLRAFDGGGLVPPREYRVSYRLSVTGAAGLSLTDGTALTLPYEGSVDVRGGSSPTAQFRVRRGAMAETVTVTLLATATLNTFPAPHVRAEGSEKTLTLPGRPRAVADTATLTDFTAPLQGEVLGNDRGARPGMLRVTGYGAGAQLPAVPTMPAEPAIPVPGSYGSLAISATGQFSYRPDTAAIALIPHGDTRADVFTYQVWDGLGDQATEAATATLSVSITGVNSAPRAMDDSLAIDEDAGNQEVPAATGVLANDEDDNQDTLMVIGFGAGSVLAATPAQPGDEVEGELGFLTLQADGAYRYRPKTAQLQSLGVNGSDEDRFRYRVGDGRDSAEGSLLIQVSGVNDAPKESAGIAGRTASVGVELRIVIGDDAFADAEGDTLTFTASGQPAWLPFDGTRTFAGTPSAAEVVATPITVTVTASDGNGGSGTATFTVTFAPGNSNPRVATELSTLPLAARTATEDSLFGLAVAGHFADDDIDAMGGGDRLRFTYSAVPAMGNWLTLTEDSGMFAGTPRNEHVGSYQLSVRATDMHGAAISSEFTLIVANVNDAPVLSPASVTARVTEAGGDQPGIPEATGSFGYHDDDADDSGFGAGGDLQLRVAGGSWETVPATGLMRAGSYGSLTLTQDGQWTYALTNSNTTVDALNTTSPTLADAFEVRIDNGADKSSGRYSEVTDFTAAIAGANDPPTVAMAIDPRTVAEGASLAIDLTAVFADVDDASLAYTVTGQPAWLQLQGGTRLEGSPARADITTTPVTVTITARDAAMAFAETTFTLTVATTNLAPTADDDELPIGEDDGAGTGGRIVRAAAVGLLANDSAGEAADVLVLRRYAAGEDIAVSPVAAGTDEAGRFGILNAAADGGYTYTLGAAAQALDEGETQVDVFAYEIDDGAGAPNSRAVGRLRVRVTGANDRPRLDLGAGADLQVSTMSLDGFADLAAGGSFTYQDDDGDDRNFGDGGIIEGRTAADTGFRAGTTAGEGLGGRYGNLTLSADGSWTYRLNATHPEVVALSSGTLSDGFVFRIDDGAGAPAVSRYSAERTVTIVIMPAAGGGTEQSTACHARDFNVCSTLRYDPQQQRLTLAVGDGGVVPERFYTVSYTLGVTGAAGLRATDGTSLTLPYSGSLQAASGSGGSVSFTVVRGVAPAAISAELLSTASTSALPAPHVREEGRLKTLTVPARPRAVADDALLGDLTAPVSGQLLANDRAAAAGMLQVTAYAAGNAVGSAAVAPDEAAVGSYGSLAVTAQGAFTYTPDAAKIAALGPGNPATDSFAYRAWDGLGAAAAEGNYADAVLTVRILGQDRPPMAVNDGASIMEEDGSVSAAAATGLLANDSDDGGSLAVTGYTAGTALAATPTLPGEEEEGEFGFLTVAADGSFTYRLRAADVQHLAEDAEETDEFTYQVSDGTATASARLEVTITGENDGPERASEIPDQNIVELQPLSLAVAGHFSDRDDGDRLRFRYTAVPAIVTEPVWLTLDEDSGLLAGTPPVGAQGDFTITVVAADTLGAEAMDSFMLGVTPAPSTVSVSAGSADNGSVSFTVTRAGGNTAVPLELRVSLTDVAGDDADSYLLAADVGERLVRFAADETDVMVTARRNPEPTADSGTVRLTVLPSADGSYLTDQAANAYSLPLERPLPTYRLAARYDAARDTVTVSLAVASGRFAAMAQRQVTVAVAVDGGLGLRRGGGLAGATDSVDFTLDGTMTQAEAEWAVDRSAANVAARFTATVGADLAMGGLADFEVAGERELAVDLPYRNYRPMVDQGIPELRVRIGADVRFAIPDDAFTDPNGDPLTYTAPTHPPWLSFAGTTFTGVAREDTVTPPATFMVTVRASDGSETVETMFAVVVTDESAFRLDSVGVTADQVTLSLTKVAGPTAAASLDFAISGAVGLLTGHDFRGRVTVPAPALGAGGSVTAAFQRAPEGISPGGAIRFELVAGTGYVPVGDAVASTEVLADLKPAFGIAVATPADPAATVDFVLSRLGSNTAAATVAVSLADPDGALAATVGASQTVAFAAGENERPLSLALAAGAAMGHRVTAAIAATMDYHTGPVMGATVNTSREEATAVVPGNMRAPVITGTVPDQVTAPGRQFDLNLRDLVQLSDTDSPPGMLTLAVTGLPEGIAYLEAPRRLTGMAAATAVGEHTVILTPMDEVPLAGTPLTFQLFVVETVVSLAVEHVRVGDLLRVTVTQLQGMTRTRPLQLGLTVRSPAIELRQMGTGSMFGLEHVVEVELPALMADGATVVTDFAFDRAGRPGSANGDEIAIALGPLAGATAPEFLIDGAASLSQRVPFRPANAGPRAARAIARQRAWLQRDFAFQFPAHDAPDGVFADEDYDRLSYSARLADSSALPAWLRFDPATRAFSGEPPAEDLGQVFVVRLTATDLAGETVTTDFNLEILRANIAPRVVQPIADTTIGAGSAFALDGAAVFMDADPGDTLSYAYSSDLDLSSWLGFTDGSFSGVPPNGFSGTAVIDLTVTDGAQESATERFTLTIEPVTVNLALAWDEAGDAAVVTVTQTLGLFQQEQTLTVTVEVDDGLTLPDDTGMAVATLTMSAVFGPADNPPATRRQEWLIDRAAATGRGRLTAELAPLTAAGDDFFAIATANGEHPLTVPAYRNTVPVAVAATARQLAVTGEAFRLELDTLFRHDDPLDPLAFTVTGLPAWLRVDDATQALAGLPEETDITVAPLAVMVTATDTDGAAAAVSLPLTVTDLTGAAPRGEADALTVGEDDGRVTAPDSLLANDRLTDPRGSLTVTRVAAGALLGAGAVAPGTAVAGAFGSLTVMADGSYVYEVNAAAGALGMDDSREDRFAYELTDGRARGAHSLATAVLTVTVMGANDGPRAAMVVADQEAAVGEAFSLTLAANLFRDPEGDAFALAASGPDGAALPDWLRLTTADGGSYRLHGTPTAAAVAASPLTIVISATDALGARGELRFALAVVAQRNSPPTVAAGMVDQRWPAAVAFGFTVPADAFADEDGDSLTYSAAGLPSWLTFDSAAARFRGNPGSEHSGAVAAVTVTAADGKGGTAQTRFRVWLGDPNYAPAAMAAVGGLVAYAGLPFQWALPDNLFRDGNLDEMTFTAVMAGGGDMPGWLSFDGHGLRGLPRAEHVSAEPLMIVLRSDDIHGARGETTIGLTVAAPPPTAATMGAEDGGFALTIPYLEARLGAVAAAGGSCLATTLRSGGEDITSWAVAGVPGMVDCLLPAGLPGTPSVGADLLMDLPLVTYPRPAGATLCFSLTLQFHATDNLRLLDMALRDCPANVDSPVP